MDDSDYAVRIVAVHRELGLRDDYAAKRGLVLQREADPTVLVPVAAHPDGHVVQLHASTAFAWRRLRAAAARDHVDLLLLSGFRSVARQTEIVRRHLDAGRSLADLLRFVAAPGYSEHHTGRALDLGSPGEPPMEASFSQTAAFAWLARSAGKFGFRLSYPPGNSYGMGYEPWHWYQHNS